jgi:uncharacterized membrane protein YesL
MLIWQALKKSAADFWDEILYLMIFNLIWAIGSLFLIPLPFLTFGLWYTAHDISQGKGINFSTFWGHLRQTWRPALIWGAINLGIGLVLILNLNFYANMGTQWAGVAQIMIIAIALFWSIVQLVALTLYPHLEEPGFRLATRNAGTLVAKYPLPVLALVAIFGLIGLLTSIFPALFLLGTISLMAVFANRMVKTIVFEEMGWEEEELEE